MSRRRKSLVRCGHRAFATASRAGAPDRKAASGLRRGAANETNDEISEVFCMNCQNFESIVNDLVREP